jgi:hypothetical protein
MTTITLEAVKARHDELATMIAKIEEDMKKPAFFEYQGERIPLNNGERYIGTIISADGSRKHHLILLPGEAESINWQSAMDWAAGIGGELPDRVESALLFATAKAEFKEVWHWTRERHVSGSGFAWFQGFGYGGQLFYYADGEGRARAVRRLPL